jgi:DUF4097 and DUF4098 domain-containing protein YvlB
MNSLSKIACLFYFLLGVLNASAQENKVQVVTKNIEKTITYKDGYQLYIDGEKADVQIESWDKKQVKIQIALMAKHANRNIAERDLESMRYDIELVGKKIYVRNQLVLKSDQPKPESTFKAVYVFTVPADCPVDLRNHFGKAEISDLNRGVAVKSEFTEILLNNIQGSIGVETRFGDVEGNRLSGEMNIESTRSDITLTQLKGRVNINAKYGKIKIDAQRSLVDLNIKAEKTDILFLNPATETYSFDLAAYYGDISVPEFMSFEMKEENALNKAELNLPKQEAKVSIQTSFGNIVVLRVE